MLFRHFFRWGVLQDDDNTTEHIINETETDSPQLVEEHDMETEEITEIIEAEEDESYADQFQCGICAAIFPTKEKFLEHHLSMLENNFTCCNCKKQFKDSTLLYEHHEIHNLDEEGIILEDYVDESGNVEELVLNYDNDEVIVQQPAHNQANDLLYILDDNQCVNEVVIQEDNLPQKRQKKQEILVKKAKTAKDAVAIVNMEHGYMLPSSFLEDGEEMLEEAEDGSIISNRIVSLGTASTSKRVYNSSKPRALQPKRRHEVPDFTATNYVFVNANEEVDIPHYKCLRCDQLFINKFVFFRHIEKGKCYINNCDVCNATFSKNTEFYEHYMQEHTDRAICNFCFRTFMYEKNVKEHMLRHLDQFRHRCEDCNKGFYTVREYRNHYKNRHMGIRHKCEVCGRSFADEYYFKKHMATHAKATNITVLQISE